MNANQSVTAIILLSTLTVLAGLTGSQAGNQSNVVHAMALNPNPSFQSPFDLGEFGGAPHGRLTFLYYSNPAGRPDIEMTVKGLNEVRSEFAYALYIAPVASVSDFSPHYIPFYKLIFTTDFNGSFHAYRSLKTGVVEGASVITAWIAIEADDGLNFDPSINTIDEYVVLSGTAIRQ